MWNQLQINLQRPYKYNETACLMSENREQFEGTFIDPVWRPHSPSSLTFLMSPVNGTGFIFMNFFFALILICSSWIKRCCHIHKSWKRYDYYYMINIQAMITVVVLNFHHKCVARPFPAWCFKIIAYIHGWSIQNTGMILGLHPANERRRYKVTPSLSRPGANLESALQYTLSARWKYAMPFDILAATKQLYEWFSPSVCLPVRHTFLTMFPSSYHHEIFRNYYQWQKWCPCKRSRS